MPIEPNQAAEVSQFLECHNITQEEFLQSGLSWTVLNEIKQEHVKSEKSLQDAAEYFSNRFQRVAGVHSLKWRIKDPDHLVAKVIRNKLKHPDREFTPTTYSTEITDLIGLRTLHLFKDDWREIDAFVRKTWDLNETPLAYIREGDPKEMFDGVEELKVEPHPFNYRSIHYVIKFQQDKTTTHLIELQVRTIFEEGWSEIDHRVRYPRSSNDPRLAEFLAIFNRLAGSADEMGTFVNKLNEHLRAQLILIAQREEEIARIKSELKNTIQQLSLSKAEKKALQEKMDSLTALSPQPDRSGTLGAVSFPSIVLSNPVSTIYSWGSPSITGVSIGPRCNRCGTTFLDSSYLKTLCPSCEKIASSFIGTISLGANPMSGNIK